MFKNVENLNLFSIIEFIPLEVSTAIKQLSDEFLSKIQEIRLRADSPAVLSCYDGDYYFYKGGKAVKAIEFGGFSLEKPISLTRKELERLFLVLCQNSIHTHQSELVNGFITSAEGCRVGVAGSAVLHGRTVSGGAFGGDTLSGNAISSGGEVTSVRDITSLCIRISRNHKNCSKPLIPSIIYENRVLSTLICGDPSSGKSSILKDLAYQLSRGASQSGFREDKHSFRVSVIDERGELSTERSSLLSSCDVLKFYPKAKGIEQALRCLAPEVIIFDEMGTLSEVSSVLESLNSGVSVITSAHCGDIDELKRRPQLMMAIRSGAFEQIVFLKGRRTPGEISEILKIEGCGLLD